MLTLTLAGCQPDCLQQPALPCSCICRASATESAHQHRMGPGSQAPLQPLQDNLESQTYETFEKDGTKYAQYQAAVHAALLDRPAPSNGASTSRIHCFLPTCHGRTPSAFWQHASPVLCISICDNEPKNA